MNEISFGLQAHVDWLYATRGLSFPLLAENRQDFERWQRTMRHELARGLHGRANVPVKAEKLSATDYGAYVQEKYALDVGEGVMAPLYVLVPKGEPPYKTILALPGHDPSNVQTILGNEPDAERAQLVHAEDGDYARRFAEAGYLVCALEQRGLGERVTEQVAQDFATRSCRHLMFSYLLQGRVLMGERVWDALCALNYLETRTDVAPGGFGVTGHSAGGTTSLFLGALDTRVRSTVISGYFCTFRDSILGMQHCECNYVPRLLELGEMGDYAALLAPRALAIVHGAHDPIYPVEGTRAQFETTKHAYELCEAPEQCALNVHEGAHRYEFATSHAWFEKTL